MNYDTFLHHLITQGIAAARQDYAGDDFARAAKLAGSIDGFEACRGLRPSGIEALLKEAARKTSLARARLHESEIRPQDYWQERCREAEIEWVADCVSVVLMNQGLPPIIQPTGRAMLAVAGIIGIQDENGPRW